jgi:tRNA G18 (ribose-2'-O)-methylase SpoU
VAATIVKVASWDDPAVAPYRNVRERDLARTSDLFVIEGRYALGVLVDRGRFPVRSVLCSERRVERLAPLLARLEPSVPALVAPQRIMDAIVGFPIHRGVLAVAERGAEPSPQALLAPGGPSLVVGLVGVVNHDNVGGVLRNAAAFGATAVLLDPVSCDPLYRKAIRVSAGGALFVPFSRCASAAAMLDALEAAGYETLALSPRGARDLYAMPRGGRRALLLGAEGEGLPREVLDRTATLRIDMAPGFDSLNVAVACGIALSALR